MRIVTPLVFFLFSQTACQAQVQNPAFDALLRTLLSHDVPEISVPEAQKSGGQTFWLDAREQREYELSHIKGALHVGYESPDLQVLRQIPKDARIIVYCSVGYRSEKIAKRCQTAGFKQVYNLYGGIFEWVNQGNTVVNADGPTEQVHTYDKKWSLWLERGVRVFAEQ
ncbi:MAG: rhodanese-like domain-containing protein [Saprospiraceae bacterium]